MKFLVFIRTVFLRCVSTVSIPVARLVSFSKNLARKLNWFVLIGIALFCIVLAIVNNIRLDDEKSVEWIGTQDVMEKPADIL